MIRKFIIRDLCKIKINLRLLYTHGLWIQWERWGWNSGNRNTRWYIITINKYIFIIRIRNLKIQKREREREREREYNTGGSRRWRNSNSVYADSRCLAIAVPKQNNRTLSASASVSARSQKLKLKPLNVYYTRGGESLWIAQRRREKNTPFSFDFANQPRFSLALCLVFSSYSYSNVLNYIYLPFIYTLSNTLLLHYTLLYKIEHFTICAKSIFHHQN